MDFIIGSPPYNENSGGLVALYSLNDAINSLGRNCIVVNYVSKEIKDLVKDHTFVIYPEIIYGNPLEAKNVIRWQLNKPGFISGDETSWGENDIIAYFSEDFRSDSIKNQIQLVSFNPRIDKFVEKTKDKDIDTTVLFHKATKYRNVFDSHPKNSFVLDSVIEDMSAVVDVLSRTKRFICYDTDTYYSVIARLCGASSIVVERDGLSKKDFFNTRPFFKFGISYGFDMIDQAEEESNKVVSHILSLKEQSLQTVKNLIELCHSRLEIKKTG